MTKKRKQIPVRLNEWDTDLLLSIARAVDCSEVDVFRRALRFYAVNGPWPSAEQKRVLRRHRKRLLEIGSLTAEV